MDILIHKKFFKIKKILAFLGHQLIILKIENKRKNIYPTFSILDGKSSG